MKKIIIKKDFTGTTKYYIRVENNTEYIEKIVREFVPGINLNHAKTITLVDTI